MTARAGLLAGRQCDVSLRPLVAEQLKAIGPAAVPALTALLDVKRARPYALAALGSSVAWLVHKLKQPAAASKKVGFVSRVRIRVEQVRTVEQIGEVGSPEAIEALVSILDAKWPNYASDVFAAAAKELAKIGEPGRAALTSLLSNKNARPHAQMALGLPPSPMPQRPKPGMVRSDEAVEVQLCRVLGGSGLPLQPGETCDLAFLETQLELRPSQSEAEKISVPYRDIVALEIGGPGAQQSGGGFFALIGGHERGAANRGRASRRKTLVAVSAEQTADGGVGRAHLRVIENASAKTLTAAARQAIEPGSTIKTDGWRSYRALSAAGYSHEPHGQATPQAAGELLPWSHIVISNFKRWQLDVFHGVSAQHLRVLPR